MSSDDVHLSDRFHSCSHTSVCKFSPLCSHTHLSEQRCTLSQLSLVLKTDQFNLAGPPQTGNVSELLEHPDEVDHDDGSQRSLRNTSKHEPKKTFRCVRAHRSRPNVRTHLRERLEHKADGHHHQQHQQRRQEPCNLKHTHKKALTPSTHLSR